MRAVIGRNARIGFGLLVVSTYAWIDRSRAHDGNDQTKNMLHDAKV